MTIIASMQMGMRKPIIFSLASVTVTLFFVLLTPENGICQRRKVIAAGESHLNFWIETRTVLRFD
jgi:hypothetical protein